MYFLNMRDIILVGDNMRDIYIKIIFIKNKVKYIRTNKKITIDK